MNNLLGQCNSITEASINITLAQNLFQILAPGQSCILDSKTKDSADEDDNESTDSGMIILKGYQSIFFFLIQ